MSAQETRSSEPVPKRVWMPVWSVIFFSPLAAIAFPPKAAVLYVAAGLSLLIAASSAQRMLRWRLDRVLLAAAATALFLTASDLALRPVIGDRIGGRPEDALMRRWPSLPVQARFVPNSNYRGIVVGDLIGVSGNDAAAEPRTIVFSTDAHGFRNASGAGASDVDLIALGDSFGAGFGVSQEKTWPSLLGSEHGRRVYNLSTFGSPWNEWIHMKTELPRIKIAPGSKLVWTFFTGNDLGSDYGPIHPRLLSLPERALVRWSTFRNLSPLRRLFDKIRYAVRLGRSASRDVVQSDDGSGRPVLFLKSFLSEEERSAESVRSHPNYKSLAEVFRAMARLAADRGIQVLVVSVPTKEGVYRELMRGAGAAGSDGDAESSGFATVVGQLSRENGFDFLDLKPLLRNAAWAGGAAPGPSRMLYWRDDTHWNDEGHAAAALAIAERLSRPSAAAGADGAAGRVARLPADMV